ncbi:hypothetical protein [Halomonas rhizosphaerae]|uniref:Response regulator n=1 Tax=Halomonas rhizosphaerae TaxID=3043296 RepID=A0ABT6UYP5_9GAMM|nr:hypothetical protein [Halomonas rhizosphaerae]MDI5891107.1 hypothetical protein [Halomonas rhizosphaerae]
MKPNSFTLDARLYELLQEKGLDRFTTQDLRDAFASRLEEGSFQLKDVRRYVYEQIRRMLRVGWLVPDAERKSRGQVYHLRPMPEHLQLNLIQNGFELSLTPGRKRQQSPTKATHSSAPSSSDEDMHQCLEATLKEVRLDFLTSMGEAERYKQLLSEMPHLRGRVESEYQEAKDRSSRLLGHLRAVEKTITALSSP